MKTIVPFLKHRLIYLAILAWILVILSQLLGRLWWFAELFSHFLLYAVLTWALAIWAASGKWRIWWTIWTLFGAIWAFSPSFKNDFMPPDSGKVIWYNVHLDNPQPETETQNLLEKQADVLALAEIDMGNPRWRGLREAMPFGCEHQSSSPFALAVWAREPLARCEVKFVAGYPYIRAMWSQANTAIYALHPPPPINAELAAHRQKYLMSISEVISQEKTALVLGDLNSTSYSPIFRDFIEKSKLYHHTQFYTATWHLGLNIDHVLSNLAPKRAVIVEPLAWGASDHRALHVVVEK